MTNDVKEVQKQHKGKDNTEEEDKQSIGKWKKKGKFKSNKDVSPKS